MVWKTIHRQENDDLLLQSSVFNLGYKERVRERKRELKKMQELLQPKQASEDKTSFRLHKQPNLWVLLVSTFISGQRKQTSCIPH